MLARRRSAFTLVELLVVVTIIGMLVALLMPAINAARRSARVAQCMNNQKELGTALLIYANTKDYLPGYVNYNAGIADGMNWVISIFSQLGREDLWKVWRDTPPAPGGTYPRLNVLLCPEDPRIVTTSGAQMSYVVNCGLADSGSPLAEPNAVPGGVFLYRGAAGTNPSMSLSDIKDGTAQTLMLSERVPSPGSPALMWRNDGTESEGKLGFLWKTDGSQGVTDQIPSLHSGISVVTFCDGHQYSLRQNIDKQVFGRLMSPDGTGLSGVAAWQATALTDADY